MVFIDVASYGFRVPFGWRKETHKVADVKYAVVSSHLKVAIVDLDIFIVFHGVGTSLSWCFVFRRSARHKQNFINY